MSFRITTRLAPYVALAPVLCLLFVFLYSPLIADFDYSLHDWSSLSPTWRAVGLANFRGLLRDALFWQSLRGNILYAVVSLIFQVCFALVLAAILEIFDNRTAHLDMPARRLLRPLHPADHGHRSALAGDVPAGCRARGPGAERRGAWEFCSRLAW